MTDTSIYEDKLRVRSCGVLLKKESVLLVKMLSPVSGEMIWTAPGGGVHFGESLEETLIREFKEETDLHVEVGDLLHINELIEPPFHAIEFYYKVTSQNNDISLGSDPEHDGDRQLIRDLRFIPVSALSELTIRPESLKDVITELSKGS